MLHLSQPSVNMCARIQLFLPERASLWYAVWAVLFLEVEVNCIPLSIKLVGVLRQIAYGCLGVGVGTVMCYPSGSLKAVDYAWDSTTSKLIETSEVIKRKSKRKWFSINGAFILFVVHHLDSLRIIRVLVHYLGQLTVSPGESLIYTLFHF